MKKQRINQSFKYDIAQSSVSNTEDDDGNMLDEQELHMDESDNDFGDDIFPDESGGEHGDEKIEEITSQSAMKIKQRPEKMEQAQNFGKPKKQRKPRQTKPAQELLREGLKEEDLEDRAQGKAFRDEVIDTKRLELTSIQHQLIKEIASDLIQQFEIPMCANFLHKVQEKIRLMMTTRDHRGRFEKLSNDDELMDHLNNCKEDLYKQIFFNYREQLQTNLNRRWTKAMIKQISQQIIEDRDQYSKVQVKKGKVPKEFLWYHSSIMLSAKLMKESDETWLDLAIRAKLKVHHMKMMSMILQIESSEFAELFQKAFE